MALTATHGHLNELGGPNLEIVALSAEGQRLLTSVLLLVRHYRGGHRRSGIERLALGRAVPAVDTGAN